MTPSVIERIWMQCLQWPFGVTRHTVFTVCLFLDAFSLSLSLSLSLYLPPVTSIKRQARWCTLLLSFTIGSNQKDISTFEFSSAAQTSAIALTGIVLAYTLVACSCRCLCSFFSFCSHFSVLGHHNIVAVFQVSCSNRRCRFTFFTLWCSAVFLLFSSPPVLLSQSRLWWLFFFSCHYRVPSWRDKRPLTHSAQLGSATAKWRYRQMICPNQIYFHYPLSSWAILRQCLKIK